VSSPWEHAGLRVGFETGPEGMSWVQWRQQAIAPLGAARSDSWIAFQLAERLGLGNSFFGGSLEDGWRHVLEPSGVTLEDLQARPGGMRVPVAQQHRKYAGNEMAAPGFNTPSRRVEIYAQSFLDHGQDPLPRYVEPAVGPVSRPDLAARYPLVLTSAKTTTFCHSQHRGVASLRRLQRDPEVQLHPDAAAARGIANRDWVRIETPNGAARARARFNAKLDPGVVCAQHGWWQACEELGLDGYAPDGPDTANYNAMISDAAHDPISGSVPLRSYLCEVRAG
jgi:anaerobic selenocysteine-containing dehydrogenase